MQRPRQLLSSEMMTSFTLSIGFDFNPKIMNKFMLFCTSM